MSAVLKLTTASLRVAHRQLIPTHRLLCKKSDLRLPVTLSQLFTLFQCIVTCRSHSSNQHTFDHDSQYKAILLVRSGVVLDVVLLF